MNKCCVKNIDFCQLKQETWKTPIFEFNKDISGDSFTYKVRNKGSAESKKLTVGDGLKIVDSSTLAIQDPELTTGRYYHELIWSHDGIDYLLFQGTLRITKTGNFGNCGNCDGDETKTIVVEDGETYVINVNRDVIQLGSGGSFSTDDDIPDWDY